MKNRLAVLVLLLLMPSICDAQSRRRKYVAPPSNEPVTNPQPYTGTAKSCTDALAEVNAARALRGLKPFVNDKFLAQAAFEAAKRRAGGLIAGHLPNDFACLPSGACATAAGCAAWEPSWGWGSCCCYDNYTYAGAAWVMGSDGRRYMHLFVR